MSLRELWQLFRRTWWVIALLAVVAAVSAMLYSRAQVPLYRAHAEVVVLPSRTAWELSLYLEARMRVFRSVLLSFPQSDANLPADLAGRTYVTLVPEEGRIVVEVDDGDPQRASELANTLISRLQEWVDAFNEEQMGVDHIYVEPLLAAEPPDAPASPRTRLNTLAGAVLGAVLGVPLAFAWGLLDDRLSDPEQAAARLGIAVWPPLPPVPADEVLPLSDPDGAGAAAFHRLYARLRFPPSAGDASPAWRTLAVVGAGPAELPAAVLANLGAAVAQGGSTVLLVDADFGRPALHQPFDLLPEPSWGEFLQRGDQAALAPAETGQPGLYLLPAGREGLPPAAQAIALRRAAQALPALARAAEVVLLRLPSPLETPEALFLVGQADAVLLVGQASRTRLRQVRRLLESLSSTPARVLGLALWRAGRSR